MRFQLDKQNISETTYVILDDETCMSSIEVLETYKSFPFRCLKYPAAAARENNFISNDEQV